MKTRNLGKIESLLEGEDDSEPSEPFAPEAVKVLAEAASISTRQHEHARIEIEKMRPKPSKPKGDG
jgi:hypothetical protein